jgi:hypothetical protein
LLLLSAAFSLAQGTAGTLSINGMVLDALVDEGLPR